MSGVRRNGHPRGSSLFGSQVSCCAGPPHMNSRIHALALPGLAVTRPRPCSSCGRPSPSKLVEPARRNSRRPMGQRRKPSGIRSMAWRISRGRQFPRDCSADRQPRQPMGPAIRGEGVDRLDKLKCSFAPESPILIFHHIPGVPPSWGAPVHGQPQIRRPEPISFTRREVPV
jgi:hypothetical protein